MSRTGEACLTNQECTAHASPGSHSQLLCSLTRSYSLTTQVFNALNSDAVWGSSSETS